MIIYAKQVPPELQESPLHLDGYELADCIIYGNRSYNAHGLDLLDDLPEDIRDDLGSNPDPVALAAALTEHTGHTWEWATLTGDCQGDWQYCVYRADLWSREAITALEIEYFNKGTEWMVTTDDDNDDYTGCSVYCYSLDTEQIAQEIRDAVVCRSTDPVELYWFDGYIQTPKYRRETI